VGLGHHRNRRHPGNRHPHPHLQNSQGVITTKAFESLEKGPRETGAPSLYGLRVLQLFGIQYLDLEFCPLNLFGPEAIRTGFPLHKG
jgi:hypothetical protein